jgi:hypothetical protein
MPPAPPADRGAAETGALSAPRTLHARRQHHQRPEAAPCPAHADSPRFGDLCDHALLLILQHLRLADQLSARQASAALRRACGDAVRGLQARRGALPPAAWAAFPGARRLVVCGEGACPEPGWCGEPEPGWRRRLQRWRRRQQQQQQQQAGRQHQPVGQQQRERELVSLPDLLAALQHVAARATHLAIQDLHPGLSDAQALRLAAALAASPAAPGLLHLELSTPASLPPAALDAALLGLPRLRHLSLQCTLSSPGHPSAASAPPQPWRPAFPAGLTALRIQDAHAPHTLDLACLARLPRLQHLELLGARCSRPGALAALTGLRSLALEPHLGSGGRVELEHLQALALLTRFETGGSAIGSGSFCQLWAALAALPALQHLRLGTVLLLAGLQPLPEVTTLQAEHLVCPIAQAAAAGCLSSCLPRLRRLGGAACRELADLARAVSHHGALESVEVGSASCRGRAWCWEQACLGTLTRLRELRVGRLELWFGSGADGLLADLAGCAALEEVDVQLSCLEVPAAECEEVALVTGRSLAAVAAGACRGSLRRLHLWQGWEAGVRGVALRTVAGALLSPGAMPQLRSVRLAMDVPAAWQAQLERLGLEVEARCSCSAWGLLDCTVRLPGGGQEVRLMSGGDYS